MKGDHYKLPLNEDFDADIINWIESFPRSKKGEMVRFAIRYYMNELGEDESIKFPSQNNSNSKPNPKPKASINEKPVVTQQEQNRRERRSKPSIGNPK